MWLHTRLSIEMEYDHTPAATASYEPYGNTGHENYLYVPDAEFRREVRNNGHYKSGVVKVQRETVPRTFAMYFSLLVVLSYLFATVLFSAAAVVNPLIPVHLRIEGELTTIFEGVVLTRGHSITTPSGGTHQCNGLNGSANPHPGATCTSALSDAARKHGFTFDGQV